MTFSSFLIFQGFKNYKDVIADHTFNFKINWKYYTSKYYNMIRMNLTFNSLQCKFGEMGFL